VELQDIMDDGANVTEKKENLSYLHINLPVNEQRKFEIEILYVAIIPY
jgi:hypothetical protein